MFARILHSDFRLLGFEAISETCATVNPSEEFSQSAPNISLIMNRSISSFRSQRNLSHCSLATARQELREVLSERTETAPDDLCLLGARVSVRSNLDALLELREVELVNLNALKPNQSLLPIERSDWFKLQRVQVQ